MNIKPADLKRVILDEDDFGHEMRVGNAFSTIQPDIDPYQPKRIEIEKVEHGGTYTDPSLGKPRQFDYRCRIRCYDVSLASFKYVALAVECKNLHISSPLVVCGRPRTADESFHTFIESSCDEFGKAISPVVKKARGYVRGDALYAPGEFVGKSLLRLNASKGTLKTDQQADIYDRWSQAVQSSVELAEETSSSAEKNKCKRVLTLVLPVVVVPDNSLWTVQYDESGSISEDPAQTNQCEFFVGRRIDSITQGVRKPLIVLTHIHFATIKGFAELLSKFLKKGISWRNWDVAFPYSSEVMTF